MSQSADVTESLTPPSPVDVTIIEFDSTNFRYFEAVFEPSSKAIAGHLAGFAAVVEDKNLVPYSIILSADPNTEDKIALTMIATDG